MSSKYLCINKNKQKRLCPFQLFLLQIVAETFFFRQSPGVVLEDGLIVNKCKSSLNIFRERCFILRFFLNDFADGRKCLNFERFLQVAEHEKDNSIMGKIGHV